MVYIGCDHGGVELKNKLIDYIEAMGEEVKDLGACTSESVDYPDYGFAVGEAVAKDGGSRGIVICKTGVGMSICANKVKGVRCALCTSVDMGRLCREHNDANVLALGASNTSAETALEIAKAFLTAEFAGGRPANRVGKIVSYEE